VWNVFLYLTLLTATFGYALWRGGAPEKIAAGIILGAVLASGLVASSYRGAFAEREIGIFVVDVTMFGAAVLLALRAERFWPICMAALLGLGLQLQVLSWVAPHPNRQVYKVLHALNAYPVLLVLAAGTRRHRRRLARDGADRNWSSFSSR
jgi:hypothetical protein